MSETAFKFVIPAELQKSDDGEWRIKGLASTPNKDQQGEVLLQNGIDTTHIESGKAFFNWDHEKGPEAVLGPIDTYQRTPQGFVVEGRLFRNHRKAQAVHEIMSSLSKSDRGRMGMSVEGKVLERAGKDGKTIKKCLVTAVALTLNPVNQDSYADLVKSMTAADLDIDTDVKNEAPEAADKELTFTSSQVMELLNKALSGAKDEGKPLTLTAPKPSTDAKKYTSDVEKALGVTGGYATSTPAQLTGGNALAQESLAGGSSEPKKKKKLKKMSKEMYKSMTYELLANIQKLYPNYSRQTLWELLKDRLQRKFPEL